MFVCFLSFIALIARALAQDAPVVPTKPFTPTPIHITLNDLPPPYNTTSAAKPAIVVAIPSNATLLVPDTNFRVTIFHDNLRSPRQLAYTPNGEILVTESSSNRITMLNGSTQGVFADQSNGLGQPFGMAFTEVSSIYLIDYLSRRFSLRRVGSMWLMQVIYVDIHTKLVIQKSKVLAKFS